MTKDYQLYDEVEIIETKQRAYIVWIDDDSDHDSYLLEIVGSKESPHFYKQQDFKKVTSE